MAYGSLAPRPTFESEESYVRGAITNATHVFLRGKPTSLDGLEELLMVLGHRSTDTHPVASAAELLQPLRAVGFANLRRLLRRTSGEDLAGARADAVVLRDYVPAYVDCARFLYGSTAEVPAFAAAAPVLKRTSLGIIAVVILAMRGVFGTEVVTETLDRVRAELTTLNAGLALIDALPEEFHHYLADGTSIDGLPSAEQHRVRSAIAEAGLSLSPEMQEVLIESAEAA